MSYGQFESGTKLIADVTFGAFGPFGSFDLIYPTGPIG